MKILILGGYGNFGKRITEELSSVEGIAIYIAGRDILKAKSVSEALSIDSKASIEPVKFDINSNNLIANLREISPNIVIHTAGPFQGQDLVMPGACLEVGAHYIDLSDDRSYVCGIQSLSERAKEKDLLFVSGASSVPGLSSTIIDHYKDLFSEINSIDIHIAPGNKAERGLATIEGILSYTGHPFRVFKNRKWTSVFGWMNPKSKIIHPKIGSRWFANVDVPDLELFPERYRVTDNVSFQAGLELGFLHFIMVFMAFLSKYRVVSNWKVLSKPITKISNLFKLFGTDVGGMEVKVSGKDISNKSKTVQWSLYAPDGIGPYIPTISTIIVAKKLINDEISIRGAMPCMNLYSIDDFMPYANRLGIEVSEVING